MTRRRWSQLAAGRQGTTTVEFAIVIMAMILLVFGTIEWGRMLWTRQIVMHAANMAARCSSISSPLCNGTNTPASYAASVAAANGIKLPVADVTYTAPVGKCTSTSGGSMQYYQISVSYTFSSPLTTLLQLPASFQISSKYGC